jgi:23S rRNA pseudouridine1911/1915/1917 synthase
MTESSLPQIYTLSLPQDQLPQRLDKVLSAWGKDHHLSRTRLQSLILEGWVQVNGSLKKETSAQVQGGDWITIQIPCLKAPNPLPQDIPLSIVYEDEHLLVLNKEAGLVVHPGAGNPDHTLVNALLFHCGSSLSGISGVGRPGIVHRLDKGTSGLMVVAKHDQAHQGLAQQFEGRLLSRTYQAVVWGWPTSSQGVLTGSLGRHPHQRQQMAVVPRGKKAITHYKVLRRGTINSLKFSLVECVLETGRTHQIRVHLSHMGNSIIGDPLYGRIPRGIPTEIRSWLQDHGWAGDRQALHALQLKFIHPITQAPLSFYSGFPEDMTQLICYFNIEE